MWLSEDLKAIVSYGLSTQTSTFVWKLTRGTKLQIISIQYDFKVTRSA